MTLIILRVIRLGTFRNLSQRELVLVVLTADQSGVLPGKLRC